MTATADASAAAPPRLPETPYQGLRSYTEEDAAYFFGRDVERKTIAANLLGARLTILYGPSGVGKSSVLRAGAVGDLRVRARDQRAEEDSPGFAVVVVSAWRDDPLETIAAATRAAVVDLLGDPELPDPPAGASLEQVLAHWSGRVGGKLLVVLDQCEEYFLYHEHDRGPGTFDDQFPQAVNSPELRANFLLSIRDDSLARLDRFKGRIPNLFENRLRVDHLTAAAGRQAIELPIREYDRLLPSEEQFAVEEQLVTDVLAQVRTGSLPWLAGGAGTVRNDAEADSRIEAPFLQIVMTTLWEVETASGSRTLRAQTLRELGGAERLVRDRLADRMNRLSHAEQDVVAQVFLFLVTRSGTKIAHTAADLAEFAELSEGEVTPVLETLSAEDARILRPVAPPHEEGALRYEIFHDVLAPAVLEWRTEHIDERRQAAADARAHRERRKVLISYGIAGIALLVAAAVGVLGWWAWDQRQAAKAQQFVARATAALATDPNSSVRLAAKALGTKATPAAESAFRVAVSQSRLRFADQQGSGPVYRASYSDDGRRILSVGAQNVRVLDALTGRLVTQLGGVGRLASAGFQPGSHRVITTGWDGRVRVWAPDSAKSLVVVRCSVGLRSASLGRDGRHALVLDERGGVRIVDLAAVRRLRRPAGCGADMPPRVGSVASPPQASGSLSTRGGVNVAVFSPNGSVVALGGADGILQIRRTRTGAVLLRRPLADVGAIQSITFEPKGKLVAVTGELPGKRYPHLFRVVRVADGKLVGKLRHAKGVIAAVAFNPDATTLAESGGKIVELWEVDSGKAIGNLRGHDDWVDSIAFDRNGTLVATASFDGTARLWELRTRTQLLELRGHPSAVDSVAFSRDGSSLLTGGSDGAARVWDISTGTAFRRHHDWVLDAAVSLDGQRIFTAGADHEVNAWDATTGKHIGSPFHLPEGAEAPVNSIAFDPAQGHHRFVLALGDGTAILGDSNSIGRPGAVAKATRMRLSKTGAAVNSATFSPDGSRIVTASDDYTASIWRADGTHIKLLDAGNGRTHEGSVRAAVYSPDGRFIVTAGDDNIARVWSSAGTFLRELGGHADMILSATFDPAPRKRSEQVVVTASNDHTARVWDVTTGRELARLDAGFPLSAAAFSPDGRLVVAAGSDGITRVWAWDDGGRLEADVRTGLLLAAMRMHASYINSVAFSPDGLILTASDDRTAKLYPCETCGPLKPLRDNIRQREQSLEVLERR